MRIINSVADLRRELNAARAKGARVGMMGTSGALHAGHLSLVRAAVEGSDLPVMGYFGGGINSQMPIAYRRDPERDLALCGDAGMQIAFVPSGDFMPRRPAETVISLPTLFGGDEPGMEDPKHLHQVTFAMAKLYNIFGECRMYSGEKDWQQLAVFKRLAEDLAFPVEVISCPTIREIDGLAMSSRNQKLTPEQRAKAPLLYKALNEAAAAIEAGERALARIRSLVAERIAPLGELDYLVSVDPGEITPNDPMTGDVRLLASVKVGEIRIVDNIGARAV